MFDFPDELSDLIQYVAGDFPLRRAKASAVSSNEHLFKMTFLTTQKLLLHLVTQVADTFCLALAISRDKLSVRQRLLTKPVGLIG